MPGMGSGLSARNPTVVAAFHRALVHQGLVVLGLLAIALLAAAVLQARSLNRAVRAQAVEAGEAPAPSSESSETAETAETAGQLLPAEPLARRVVRIGFGLLWVLDGALQAQPSMPLGMVPQTIQPTANSSGGFVRQLVNDASAIWANHPVSAATAAVWIQLGIGLLLLFAARGPLSRFAGAAGAAWGAIVWMFGESFGGLFAPGASFLFGAPGAALFYVTAGILVALPDRAWSDKRTGRLLLGGLGVVALGLAVLQAWPGRGFWSGQTLHSMTESMSAVSQPHAISSAVSSLGSFAAGHGFAVNLVVVVALAVIGVCWVSGRPRLAWIGVGVAGVLGLSTWLLVMDTGMFGGVGTDPNSPIPMLLLAIAGSIAVQRAASTATAPAAAEPKATTTRRTALTPRLLLALAAAATVVVGAAPMAVAALQPNADPIVSQAVDGTPNATNAPAPPFRLVDQHGRTVSLASLRGKVVALTFLDPVCTTDCPLIAQEFRQANQALGTASAHVVMVAVAANPLFHSPSDIRAFNSAERLNGMPNWLFLTGPLQALRRTWASYGIQVAVTPGGSMVAHNDLAFVISPHGRMRYILDTDPGPGTTASKSSFAGVLASTIRSVLP